MRILCSSPDGLGELVLRQPLFGALREAGHELLHLVRPQWLPLMPLVCPGAEAIGVPLEPGATEPAGEAAAAVYARVREFAPHLMLVASDRRTALEERLAALLPEAEIVELGGGAAPGATDPAAREAVIPVLRDQLRRAAAIEARLSRELDEAREQLRALRVAHHAAQVRLDLLETERPVLAAAARQGATAAARLPGYQRLAGTKWFRLGRALGLKI